MAKGLGKPGLWLLKEEPSHYDFRDLERDGRTVWDGVRNPLPQQNMRRMKAGDRAFFYHTGAEKAIVGEARIIRGPFPDPEDRTGTRVAVEVEPVAGWPRPVTLAEIKENAALASWDLVRLPRLSVLPVTPEQWVEVERLSRQA